MPCPKGLTPLGIRLLDRHIRITVSDDLFLAVFTSFHYELLGAVWSASRLVALHLGFIDCHLCHHEIYIASLLGVHLICIVRVVGVGVFVPVAVCFLIDGLTGLFHYLTFTRFKYNISVRIKRHSW